MWFKIITLAALFSVLNFNICYAKENILPSDAQQVITQLYKKYKKLTEGKNADYIPELAKVNPNLFGIAIVTVDGEMISSGDANIPFAIESVSKPFVYALSLRDNGEQFITDKVGVNATGHHFNSILSIEDRPHHLQNPLVNAGAIQVTSFIKGKDSTDKWQRVLTFIQNASDGKPYLGETVYRSEMATNQRNRAIAELLNSYKMMQGEPLDAVDRYTKACSIMLTARQLAIMGATLANQGVNPITKKRIMSISEVKNTLSQMVINGVYENSGIWFWKVGIPSKSGVSGDILAVVPHQMAIVVFSPPIDEAGNSVRAQRVIQELAKRWKLHLLDK